MCFDNLIENINISVFPNFFKSLSFNNLSIEKFKIEFYLNFSNAWASTIKARKMSKLNFIQVFRNSWVTKIWFSRRSTLNLFKTHELVDHSSRSERNDQNFNLTRILGRLSSHIRMSKRTKFEFSSNPCESVVRHFECWKSSLSPCMIECRKFQDLSILRIASNKNYFFFEYSNVRLSSDNSSVVMV